MPAQQSGAQQKSAQGSKAGKETQDKEEKPPESKPLPQLGSEARYDYQGEITFILQHLFPFQSKYEGENSFRSRDETELSHTYTAFLGARLVKNVEVYVNPEIAWGNAISEGTGVGGNVNGDILGQPSLRPEPYLARYFVRWRVPMPHPGRHKGGEQESAALAGRAPNIIADNVPVHRLLIQVGKFGISDVFDTNAYANNPRAQFLNDAFGNNLAYDFAQETRGYDLGVYVAWINPEFTIRFGSFAMPTEEGGPDLAYDFAHNHSEQIEAELPVRLLRAPKPPLTLRLLAWRNVGDMGNYREALQPSNANSAGLPDIEPTRRAGREKYGFGLNFEQALADGGNTGVFGRLGWNDGETENFAFAECNRFLSAGGQLSGARWHRKDDIVGLAFALSELSKDHRAYLMAGGLGGALGDGSLHYGSERILEAYYSYQLTKPLSLSLDYQFVTDPGYNRDRGPASLLALRAHLTF